jgi:hypothetical protein
MVGRVRFEVFTAVTMKNGVFCDVTLWYFFAACRLLVTASVVPNSPILVTLMMEALSSSKRRFLQEPHGVTSQKTTFSEWKDDGSCHNAVNSVLKDKMKRKRGGNKQHNM